LASDLAIVLGVRATGKAGSSFLASEMLGRVNVLFKLEGSERLNGSDDRELVFLTGTDVTALVRFTADDICFSADNPPVLFLLTGGTELKFLEALLKVDFAIVDLTEFAVESEPFVTSILFLLVPIGAAADNFETAPPFGFTNFTVFLTFPTTVEFSNLEIGVFSAKSSPALSDDSSILYSLTISSTNTVKHSRCPINKFQTPNTLLYTNYQI
jgi:hypothetical protein